MKIAPETDDFDIWADDEPEPEPAQDDEPRDLRWLAALVVLLIVGWAGRI